MNSTPLMRSDLLWIAFVIVAFSLFYVIVRERESAWVVDHTVRSTGCRVMLDPTSRECRAFQLANGYPRWLCCP